MGPVPPHSGVATGTTAARTGIGGRAQTRRQFRARNRKGAEAMSRAMLARKAEAAAPATKTKAASTGLRIGEVNDSFEREADRVADAVMAGTQNWSLSGISSGAPVQRKCECGASAGSGGQCEERKKKEGTVQRRAVAMPAMSAAPPRAFDTR